MSLNIQIIFLEAALCKVVDILCSMCIFSKYYTEVVVLVKYLVYEDVCLVMNFRNAI
jgi:hypothetical protein